MLCIWNVDLLQSREIVWALMNLDITAGMSRLCIITKPQPRLQQFHCTPSSPPAMVANGHQKWLSSSIQTACGQGNRRKTEKTKVIPPKFSLDITSINIHLKIYKHMVCVFGTICTLAVYKHSLPSRPPRQSPPQPRRLLGWQTWHAHSAPGEQPGESIAGWLMNVYEEMLCSPWHLHWSHWTFILRTKRKAWKPKMLSQVHLVRDHIPEPPQTGHWVPSKAGAGLRVSQSNRITILSSLTHNVETITNQKGMVENCWSCWSMRFSLLRHFEP